MKRQICEMIAGGSNVPELKINPVREGNERTIEIVPGPLALSKGPKVLGEELGKITQILDEAVLQDQVFVVPDQLTTKGVGEQQKDGDKQEQRR